MLRLLSTVVLTLLSCQVSAEGPTVQSGTPARAAVGLPHFSGDALAMADPAAKWRRSGHSARAESYLPPDRVKVLPIFVVPQGEKPPTAEQMVLLMRHVQWAQKRFFEMLRRRDTFEIADVRPHVYRGQHDLAFYRQQREQCAPQWTSELLRHYGFNRFTCPWILLAIVMNPHDGFPVGGGRPLGGGINTGGGIVIVSAHGLFRKDSRFQSTLQHELGHAFGLPHVEVYGYNMKSNPSIMSYNPEHHAKGFQPAENQAILIPEDIRALALNKRAFRKLKFNPAKDIPQGYSIRPRIVCLGPMTIPGELDCKVLATTPSGAIGGSSVSRVVQGQIKPSRGPEDRFDRRTMWSSAPSADGLVSVELEFPMPVRLNKIGVHCQYGGRHDAARAVGVQALVGKKLRTVTQRNLESVDDYVSFRPTKAKKWKLVFQAGPSRKVVIRGLQFFSGRAEIFPPLVPYGSLP